MRHLKTYEVSLKDKDFASGPWQQTDLDATASLLIPIPPPLGGVVLMCEHSLTYTNGAAPGFQAVFCVQCLCMLCRNCSEIRTMPAQHPRRFLPH